MARLHRNRAAMEKASIAAKAITITRIGDRAPVNAPVSSG